jgi:RHS repeat-associated protein
VFLILGAAPPLAYSQDTDGDTILDEFDNCLEVPNGPLGGTCISGAIGDSCMSDGECGEGGFCSKNQEDTYPPQGNGIGDACDCECDFNCDGNVDAADIASFVADFGRSYIFNPCANDNPCNGDCECDTDVDADDVEKLLEDFGRSWIFNPCPACVAGDWCVYPPPDPSDIAPPIDPTVATTMFAATEFLYTGSEPIQTGVTPGTIEMTRVAVLRGKVMMRDGQPISEVIITVLNHPEFGQTLTRSDGMFDIAVNGGGYLTISYQKDGYLTAQRQIDVPWQDYAWLPDVVMIPLDLQVTTIDLTSIEPVQVAQGSVVTDDDGTRQATMLIPQGTSAELVLPDDSTQPISTLNVRATEYTVGQSGPNAMPAILPSNSGYTYAVEFTADEALSAEATDVRFDQPIYSYVENFLGFPVGEAVPAGYYDKERGVWVPSDNGRVIEVLSITSGLADLDTDGDASADDSATLATLGITDAEREKLANLYVPGQSLWRVPITHFTPWDWNWPFGPPDDAEPPQEFPPDDDKPEEDDCEEEGSIIGCQNQILGERIPIVGTPFTLNYRSDRVPGRLNTLVIPLIGDTVPASLTSIKLEIKVAGRRFTEYFSPTPNQRHTFVWDGMDAYGRTLQGRQPVTVNISYGYPGQYNYAGTTFLRAFAASSGVAIEGVETRQEVWFGQRWSGLTVGGWDARGFGLGGWSIDAHQVYDPFERVLYLGTGKRRSVHNLNLGIWTVAGNGTPGYSGDGGPATEAQLQRATATAVGPDGSFYIADQVNHVIRRVDPDGIITTVAGNGTHGYSGDGGPATQAQLNKPIGIALAQDGSFYIADRSNHVVRWVDRDGLITTVAGNGNYGCGPIYDFGDNGPAIEAQIPYPRDVAIASDGSLYIVSGCEEIRRVSTDGIITTVAGTGVSGFGGDGGPATEAQLDYVSDIAVAQDGSFYIGDGDNYRIRRVGPDGIITTVAGNGIYGDVCEGDGNLATNVALGEELGVAVDSDGRLYIADADLDCVRRVDPDGIITTVAGNGTGGYSGDNGPATAAQLDAPWDVALAPDGSLYIAHYYNYVIRKVATILPGLSIVDIAIPSKDGSEIYVFNSSGRHLLTLHALTGETLLQFSYDSNGLLTQIEDGDGNITIIERDSSDNPTAIVSSYGQRTNFSVDANGYLNSITNPAGGVLSMTYSDDGLLETFTDHKGAIDQFSYDSGGRLLRDQDPVGGYQDFVRTDFDNGYEVTRTTATGRTTTYRVENLPTGKKHLVNTFPDNTQVETVFDTDGTSTNTFPDGSTTVMLNGPDPRWGMQSSLPQSLTITTPGGLSNVATAESSVVLTDPYNLLSLSEFHESVSINGRTYTSTYVAATSTFTTFTPVGRQTTSIIDNQGRPLQVQVAGLYPASFIYNTRGQLISQTMGTQSEERNFTFDYYNTGDISTITDPLGHTVGFEYDAAGRVIQETLLDGRMVNYTHDANGNITSITPPGRPSHTFSYSAVDLEITYSPPDVLPGSDHTEYAYNLDRELILVTRPDGQTIQFDYDGSGCTCSRLSSITYSGKTISYTYDLATGDLTSINAPSGVTLSYQYDGSFITREAWSGAITGSISYTYDDNLRLTSLTVNSEAPVNFLYDNDSLLIQAGPLSIDRNQQNGLITGTTLGNVTEAWTYNGFAEPTHYSVTYDTTDVYSVVYTRDKLGRITEKSEIIDGLTNIYGYTYDLAGRLIEVTENATTIATYTYDSNSNRLSYTPSDGGTISGTYDDQDRITQYGTTTYTYTANGELLSKTTDGQTITYDYDVLGNLMAVTLPDATQVEYLVDGQDRRVGKKVNGTLLQCFLYQDDIRPIAELDGNMNVVSRFVYASRSNIPDYMSKGGVTYRIIADQLGSPRLVIDPETGAILQRMDYDEFGNISLDTNPGFQPFGFAGGMYDRDTGLVLFGARDYDPEQGRWTAKDPILFNGDQFNLYSYVINDPVNHTDLSGLKRKPTVVCDGVGGFDIDVPWPRGVPRELVNCLTDHELCHKGDWERDKPRACIGKRKGTIPKTRDKKWRDKGELKCYKEEIDCLQKLLPNCNDAGLKDKIVKRKKKVEKKRKTYLPKKKIKRRGRRR